LLFDLAVAPLLCWRRTRLFAFVWAVSFHLLNKWLLGVGIFPWFSIAATLLFFPPDWPRRVAGWVARRFRPHAGESVGFEPAAPAAPAPAALTGGERTTLALLGIFTALQIFLPLRKHLYPGNVNWTEQGHNFAWHMKLRDKSATAQFTARFPATGETVEIDLEEWLTPRQIRKMPIRPRMILQFSHHLARELERPDGGRPEIRARVECRLNGRPPALLIDPEVNLAALRPSLKSAPWILPLTEPLPSPETTRRQAAYARRALDRDSLSREERRRLQRIEGD
jgi:hypothetical protein